MNKESSTQHFRLGCRPKENGLQSHPPPQAVTSCRLEATPLTVHSYMQYTQMVALYWQGKACSDPSVYAGVSKISEREISKALPSKRRKTQRGNPSHHVCQIIFCVSLLLQSTPKPTLPPGNESFLLACNI